MTGTDPTSAMAMRCAECGRTFVRDAIVLDDQAFCCLGCLASGPCICEDAENRGLDATPTAPNSGSAVALEIGPFNGQPDLMHLATLLEARPGIGRVELVVADPRRARFAIEAASPASVASAVADLPGYEATVSTSGNTVSAIVATHSALSSEEALLPPRTRFRVFHGGGEPVQGMDPAEQFHP